MDIMELTAYLLTPAAQVALIIGLAEIVKQCGLDKKWVPLVDVGLGLISGIGVYGVLLGQGIVNGIVIGLALGLSACGLFSGIKNLTEKQGDNHGNDGSSI